MSTRNPRLQDVLRAGVYQLEATGAKGDAGSPPKLKKAASAPAAPAGVTMRAGPSPAKKVLKDSNDLVPQAKNSEVVKDIVNAYKEAAQDRLLTLKSARNAAKICAEKRIKAVEDYQKDQEEAANKTIKDLQDRLAVKDAAIDKLQSASDEATNKLLKSGGENTKQVDLLKQAIEKLKAEKASVQTELEKFKESTNKARDDARALAETSLKDAKANAAVKLKECEARNAKSGVVEGKKLTDALESLRMAEARILQETTELAKLKVDQATEAKAFRAAAQAACDALKPYTTNK